MAIKIRFDYDGSVEQPTLILASRSGKFIHQLPIYQSSFRDSMNDGSEFQFQVSKTDCVDLEGEIDLEFWKSIKDLKLAYCKEYDRWYELRVEINEDNKTIKTINAVSLGKAELSQIMIYDMEVNTESDINRDDYSPTVLYDSSNPECSLIDRLLSKAPHYRVGYVDESIASMQRTFSFNNSSIDDCFKKVEEEIGCLVEYECTRGSDGKGICRKVNIYDLQSVCRACGKRGDFISACDECGSTDIRKGYGEDTHIFVSSENLADLITYSTDVDQVKNCFRLVAGDDLMTATIANCNANGSEYIWFVSDEMREDMSEELRSKLSDYDDLYYYYQNDYIFSPDSELAAAYNAIVEKYKSYNPDLSPILDENGDPVDAEGQAEVVGYPDLMQLYYDVIDLNVFLQSGLAPTAAIEDTTAAAEALKLNRKLTTVAVSDISKCSKTTVTSAVLSFARAVVDKRYDVSVVSGDYTIKQWIGTLSVTNRYDEEDTAIASITADVTDDFEAQTKQKLEAVLQSANKENYGVSALFALDENDFKAALEGYSLTGLTSLRDTCLAAVNVLIGQGVSDVEGGISSSELYTELYQPYYAKLGFIDGEIAVREGEINVVSGQDGMRGLIENARSEIHAALNFENYIGQELWEEFAAYRRESTYENSNYISDGLTTEEIFANALEFLEIAQKDIFKSATQQHVISCSLKNLLVMDEFSPIVDSFSVGNWIRVEIDGEVYRLRLIEYEFDYGDAASINVTFSDVRRGAGTASDLESILQQASSMATVFDAVAHQAGKGTKGASYVFDWLERGMDLTNTKIVSTADNQDIVYDRNGLVAREYDPFLDEYDQKQVKVINRGVYVTDDGWETATAGIGEFVYWDPVSKSWQEDFGVIAKKLVASLMLSEEVMVYNQNNSIQLGESGIVVTTEAESNDSDGIAFTIRRHISDENGDRYEPILSVNNEGRLVLDGSFNVRTSSGDTSALNSFIDSISLLEQKTDTGLNDVKAAIAELQTSSDNLTIQVAELANAEEPDAYEIKSTGYRFDLNGLKIRKGNDEIENLLTNTGMYVNRYSGETSEPILVADKNGVDAINVSVRQYLIIGNNARFENYMGNRTGCYYIGE